MAHFSIAVPSKEDNHFFCRLFQGLRNQLSKQTSSVGSDEQNIVVQQGTASSWMAQIRRDTGAMIRYEPASSFILQYLHRGARCC